MSVKKNPKTKKWDAVISVKNVDGVWYQVKKSGELRMMEKYFCYQVHAYFTFDKGHDLLAEQVHRIGIETAESLYLYNLIYTR